MTLTPTDLETIAEKLGRPPNPVEEFKRGLKAVAISDLTLKELEGAPPFL